MAIDTIDAVADAASASPAELPKLTVLIPCKNEAHNLANCIRSVRSIADEILIADSGSTDDSLAIAAGFGCRVIQRDYVNSGDFKNWAIPQADHPWVLIVDADERVTPKLATEIADLLQTRPAADGFWIRRRNYFLGHPVDHGDWGDDFVIRLIRRDHARYKVYTDHTEVDLPRNRTSRLRHRMLHYTCWDYDAYMPKMLHYARQQARLWHRQGKRPSLVKLFATGPFRFFRSFVVDRGFLDGSIGFQVAMLTGFYSFVKQAQLWQLTYGKQLQDVEASSDA